MVKAVGSKQRDVKNANHRLILTQLRQHDLLSRSELARMLSLSAPSISKNVDDLIGRNVLIETGTVATNVGRRPSLVGINRQYGCVAAVDFSSTDIRIAISNMKADMIDYGTVPGESRLNMSHLEQTIALLGEMLERHQMRERLLAISIGTPGDIDRQTGYFLYAPRFEDCTKLNLHTIFQEAFGVDVLVKNDVNLATMGENLFGAGGGCRNMLYIALDYGIGSGMILDGRLFEGARGFSGEIGLWLMDPQEAYERYRQNTLPDQLGLDSIVSCFAIRQNVRHRLAGGGFDGKRREHVRRGLLYGGRPPRPSRRAGGDDLHRGGRDDHRSLAVPGHGGGGSAFGRPPAPRRTLCVGISVQHHGRPELHAAERFV